MNESLWNILWYIPLTKYQTCGWNQLQTVRNCSLFFLFLFWCCFTSHSRIVHSYGDVPICRWKASHFGICSALMAVRVFYCDTGPRVLLSHPKDRKPTSAASATRTHDLTTSRSKVERATDWATGPARTCSPMSVLRITHSRCNFWTAATSNPVTSIHLVLGLSSDRI